MQTRPAWPPAGSPGHRRLCASGEEGGAAPKSQQSHPLAGLPGLCSGPRGCKAVTPNPSLLRHTGRTHSRAPTPQQVSSRAGRGREIPPAAADVTGASLGLPRRAPRPLAPCLPPPETRPPGARASGRVHGSGADTRV